MADLIGRSVDMNLPVPSNVACSADKRPTHLKDLATTVSTLMLATRTGVGSAAIFWHRAAFRATIETNK